MTSHIVLSTPVENPADSSNPVESGLVFEMVKSGPVRSRSGQIYSDQVPASIPNPVSRTLVNIFDINDQPCCFDRGEPFAPVSPCRFILMHTGSYEQKSGLPNFQLLAVLAI